MEGLVHRGIEVILDSQLRVNLRHTKLESNCFGFEHGSITGPNDDGIR